MKQKDIYRSANLLIEQYQEGALLEAMKRQIELRDKGDETGAYYWQKIGDAITFFQMPADLHDGNFQ